MKKIILLFITVLLSNLTFGQGDIVSAQQTLKDRGEVYFKFNLSDEELFNKDIIELSTIISIDRVDGNELFAYANAGEFGEFVNFNIDFEVLTPPSMMYKSILENALSTRNTDDWDYYPSYDEYINIMNQFSLDYPDLCEVVNIGYSGDGRELLFIHINNNLGVDQNEPEFMYTATMHGDEVTGYVLMLRYIDYLLQNYGTNSEITNLVDNIDIWINPLANPDGTYAGGNNSVWGATRYNANYVDLNRNYADPEDGPHPDGNAYQIETLAFMDFAEEHDFVMSSNLHGGAEVLNYPWDTWAQLSADNDWWVFVCREYADTVHANAPSGYLTDYNDGITNGYAWYSISGGRQDYMNYFHSCREMTLEISSDKMPQESQLPGFWEYNYRSFKNYMGQSLYGFSGIVTNSVTGNPVRAKVFVENHDMDSTWVFSQQETGSYHRPIKTGTYDVTFSAFGYNAQTIEDIVIVDYSTLNLDVELEPYSALTADFYASSTVVPTGNSIDFFNESWGSNIVSWLWTFEGGEPSTSHEENPVGIVYENSGEYDVTLVVSNMIGDSDTKVRENYISVMEIYNMDNETITTCDALFFDTGGKDSNYSDDEDLTMTFFPFMSNSVIRMEFVEFSVEDQATCDYDYMEVFDGTDINAPLIGTWCGTNSPGTLIASNDQGALTVFFHSDNNVTLSGWEAIISCDSNVGILNSEETSISIYPNPANNELNIMAYDEIMDFIISDIRGRVIYKIDNIVGIHSINISDFDVGIYVVSYKHKGSVITKKVVKN